VNPERSDEKLLSLVLAGDVVIVPERKEVCEPLREPAAHSFRLADDLSEVAVLEPEVPQRVLVQVAGEGLGEEDAVDPTGGRARDRIDDDPRVHVPLLAQCLEQLAIGELTRCFLV
jgi:hypothetical protein